MIKRSLSIITGALTMTCFSAMELERHNSSFEATSAVEFVEQITDGVARVDLGEQIGITTEELTLEESKEQVSQVLEKVALPKAASRARSGSRTPSKDQPSPVKTRANIREKIAASRSEKSEGKLEDGAVSSRGDNGSRASSAVPSAVSSVDSAQDRKINCLSCISPSRSKPANTSKNDAPKSGSSSSNSPGQSKLTEAALASKEKQEQAAVEINTTEANSKE